MGPEIALAASARSWPDRLHRFLLDHGGGRVRTRVMDPDQATTERYDVLFIDDVCSFLTPRLVQAIRESGKEMVGVFDPVDAEDAKRHLLECGVTDVIEADASPEEFLAVASATMAHKSEVTRVQARKPKSFRVGVVGAIGGVGATEIAIGVAASLAATRATVLVDLDRDSPSVAQRLDLPLHPNLLTALDAAHHHQGRIREAVLTHQAVDVVGGLATSSSGLELAPVEMEALLDEVGSIGYDVVVADLGSPSGGLDILRFHVLIAVGLGNPVGVGRLVRLVQALSDRASLAGVVAVVNRVPPRTNRMSEIRAEMARLVPGLPVIVMPEDRRLEQANWDGVNLTRGHFVRSVKSVASVIDGGIG